MQITIKADGALEFGADLSDFTDIENDYVSKPTTSFRLRFNRARSRLASFVPIGKYPLDAIAVTPGREPLKAGYYAYESNPQTDLEFRFDVPITLRVFSPRGGNALWFGTYLNPLDVSVERGADLSSVVITIVPDRIGARLSSPRAASTPGASTPEGRFSVLKLGAEKLQISASRAPLGELLDEVARAMNVPLAPDASLQNERVSLYLPDANLDDFSRALANGFDLVFVPRAENEGGGFRIARGELESIESPSRFERVALNYLSPERARLLFPDFLLPLLRADKENNALIVSGSPRLIARIKADLKLLDVAPPQVRIEATAWEIADARDANYALRVMGTMGDGEGRKTLALDTGSGQYSFRADPVEARNFSAAVQALASRGRARLAAKPFLLVASGQKGSLFLGQTRFIPVLQNQGGGQNIEALQLAIGTTLNVRPVVGAGNSILLEVNPRVSTVDEREAATGLPTLGVRETNGVLQMQSGDTILLGGLDADLDFESERGKFLNSSRSARSRSSLLILVTARVVEN